MKLTDFERSINTKLLQKGQTYFEGDLVDNLEKVASGLWMAQVHGTESYLVSVKTSRTQLKGWECDCPYDHGPICKHVIAVFYAIADELAMKSGGKRNSSSGQNRVEVIFEKASKSDLEKFITEQFRWNKGLKNVFISHFAELLDEDPDKKYRTIIRNAYKSAQDSYGFIDYSSVNRFHASLNKLVDKAKEVIGNDDLMESLSIVKIIIEEIPVMLHNMDDSSGGGGGVFYTAAEVFSEIAGLAPPSLKDDLFDYCLKEYPKSKYADFGFEEIFLENLSILATKSEQEKAFFKLINDELAILQNEGHGDYRIVQLIEAQLAYFLANGRNEEAQTLIVQNNQYPEFRQLLVDQAIESKDWQSAKVMCQDGIRSAEETNHSGTVMNWYIKLLEIAKKEGDINDQRTLSEKLFFDSNYDMSYYKSLKSTYKKGDWVEESEGIINKLKGPKQVGSYYDLSTLAQIFIEENYQERLLKLLELNAKRIQFLDAFKDSLSDSYSEKLAVIYAEGIMEYAKLTGRNIYNEVARYLKKLQDMKGGKTQVKLLIGKFRVQYKMRPAMMEILNEKFPETIELKGNDVQKMIDKNLRLF